MIGCVSVAVTLLLQVVRPLLRPGLYFVPMLIAVSPDDGVL